MSDVVYDHLHIITMKGKKDVIKTFAQDQSKSLNAFVNEAIDEKMKRDTRRMNKLKKV